MFGPGTYLRITPTVSWSWNLESLPFDGSNDREFIPRRTVHRPDATAPAAETASTIRPNSV
ncbi:hypothetical protein [Microlunatus parietis]|uniref:Uncharacterized protein n=1 Tax=Microlunatus parietis TaxID=682979 RepID=A0A7Y9LBM4_9ACTN|nr:hypothetical protein [Microlunatus parietis]NYE73979.1 hypothetical protein [Microlunatus parietis]